MLLLAQPALRGGREDEQNSSFLPGAISSSRRRLPVQMEEERAPAAGAGSGRARRCGFVVWLHGLGDYGHSNEFNEDGEGAARRRKVAARAEGGVGRRGAEHARRRRGIGRAGEPAPGDW